MSLDHDNLTRLVVELGEVTELIKSLTEKQKELKSQTTEAFLDRGAITVQAEDGQSWQFEAETKPGRKTLDKDALTEHFGDKAALDPFYKVGKPFVQTSIKKVG